MFCCHHYKKLSFQTNLRDKLKYVVYYHNLNLYTELGMVVTKVHHVLQFKQSPYNLIYA